MVAWGRKEGKASPRQFWSEERNLTLLLAALAFDTLVFDPMTSVFGTGIPMRLFDSLVFTLVLLLGLIALTRHRTIQVVFGFVTLAIIAARFSRLYFEQRWLIVLDLSLSALCVVTILVIVLCYTYRKGQVTSHRILGAVAGYLLMAMTFACGYLMVYLLLPGAFRFHGDSLVTQEFARTFYYFSISTLTTVGFGDITPVHPLARSLAMMEALFGQLYPAILIARLVALHISSRDG